MRVNPSPITIALQEIRETRLLLETVVVSSETFNYPQAKDALKKLQRKIRDLAKLEQKLLVTLPPQPVAEILQFPARHM